MSCSELEINYLDKILHSLIFWGVVNTFVT